jgi:hypothetical protein
MCSQWGAALLAWRVGHRETLFALFVVVVETTIIGGTCATRLAKLLTNTHYYRGYSYDITISTQSTKSSV